jgi:hypothetical protein
MTTAITEAIAANPLEGYAPDAEMAKIRGKTVRTQRAERQRGEGPPYVKDGKKIYYSVAGYRDWLRACERQPVRGLAASTR